MKRIDVEQLTFLPGTNTSVSYRLKPARRKEEAVFMKQLQQAAALLGLPSLHVDYYCGNRFNVRCSCCGHVEVVTCHKWNNQENAGLPDLCGIAWGIETKIGGNTTTARQNAVHDSLRRKGVPVFVARPDDSGAAVKFLQRLSRKEVRYGSDE